MAIEIVFLPLKKVFSPIEHEWTWWFPRVCCMFTRGHPRCKKWMFLDGLFPYSYGDDRLWPIPMCTCICSRANWVYNLKCQYHVSQSYPLSTIYPIIYSLGLLGCGLYIAGYSLDSWMDINGISTYLVYMYNRKPIWVHQWNSGLSNGQLNSVLHRVVCECEKRSFPHCRVIRNHVVNWLV